MNTGTTGFFHTLRSLFVEIYSLLVTRCKINLYLLQNLLVAEVTRCKKSLVTRCKIRSLLVAEVTRCKNSLIVKNHSLLLAKFDRYLLYKVTKESQVQLNLVMDNKYNEFESVY